MSDEQTAEATIEFLAREADRLSLGWQASRGVVLGEILRALENEKDQRCDIGRLSGMNRAIAVVEAMIASEREQIEMDESSNQQFGHDRDPWDVATMPEGLCTRCGTEPCSGHSSPVVHPRAEREESMSDDRMFDEANAADELLREALDRTLMTFADWAKRHWKHQTREQWTAQNAESWPGDEYARGYNAAVDSFLQAAECFLEDRA